MVQLGEHPRTWLGQNAQKACAVDKGMKSTIRNCICCIILHGKTRNDHSTMVLFLYIFYIKIGIQVQNLFSLEVKIIHVQVDVFNDCQSTLYTAPIYAYFQEFMVYGAVFT